MGKFSNMLARQEGSTGKEPETFSEAVATQEQEKEKQVNAIVEPHSLKTSSWDERLKLVGGLSNNAAESFRILRSRILHPLDGGTVPRTIMIASALAGEGKTFVAANLAIMLAQNVDQYSMLVDCDLRNPSVARMFGVSNVSGLVNYLEQGDDLGGLIQKCSVDKLSLLPGGLTPSNPSELLGSEKMDNLVKELSERYEDRFIVFDSPPLQLASEGFVLSQKVDGVILVVRYGIGVREQVLRCVENIGRKKILGVIFNGVESNIIELKLMQKYGPYDRYSHSPK